MNHIWMNFLILMGVIVAVPLIGIAILIVTKLAAFGWHSGKQAFNQTLKEKEHNGNQNTPKESKETS